MSSLCERFLAGNCFVVAILFLSFTWCAVEDAGAWETVRSFDYGETGAKARGSDAFDYAAGHSFYRQDVETGRKFAELNITKGDTAYGTWGGIIEFPAQLGKGNEIWISLDLFLPPSFIIDTDTNFLKFLRLRHRTAQDTHEGSLENFMTEISAEGSPYSYHDESTTFFAHYGDEERHRPRGEWFNFEWYVKFSDISVDSGGQGVSRTWINNELVVESTAVASLDSADSLVESLLVFTYWNGGAPQTQWLGVDNITVTSDRPALRDNNGNPYIGGELPVRPVPMFSLR